MVLKEAFAFLWVNDAWMHMTEFFSVRHSDARKLSMFAAAKEVQLVD